MAGLELAALLNPEQLEAATTTEGPLLVLAGAGSGKTRVLVHRIAHILESGLAEPYEILAVTFTNKAAGEMRHRLRDMLGPRIDRAWIGTFHALCARMLRFEGHRLGYTSGFSIYDEDDSRRLLKGVLDELGIDTDGRGLSVADIDQEIDRAKNRGKLPGDLDREGWAKDDPQRRLVLKVFRHYQDALRRANAMDFGDLLLLALELFRHHEEARLRFARRFRYVMVDEFQDTNGVQYELLRRLVAEHKNLMVVGDDDQAIYRWRGADVGNILGFPEHYPQAKVVRLERNYRSSANVLAAANAIIKKNRRRHPKTLRTEAAAGAAVGVAYVDTSEEEAVCVAQLIQRGLREGRRPEEHAVLYRQNAQSRLFEEALRRLGVPFVLIGGVGFYERKEVKDVLAYLRLTANPRSRADFERVVNVPPRGLGEKTLAALKGAAEGAGKEGAEMLELPRSALEAAGLKKGPIEKLQALGRLLSDLRALAETGSATEVARRVVEGTGYLEHLSHSDGDSADERRANVEELVSSIAQHEEQLAQGPSEEGLGLALARTPLQAYLDAAALTSPADEGSREGAVSLLTLHAAKGLEFPYVFLVGLEEQTFPSKRAVEGTDPEAMEEERRLCYVGMTRAMRELVLAAARRRRIYGREEPRWPSRFLGELPDELVAPAGSGRGRPSRGPPGHGGSAAYPELRPRMVTRGSDAIVYDDGALIPPQPEGDLVDEPNPLRPGGRVFHNSFGEGTIEDIEGRGPGARLTIRFPAGVRRVVARFVRSTSDS